MSTLVPAPPGYVVDFDNPARTDDIAAYWCYGVGVFFSLLFTAQRVYVKIAMKLPWQLDDSLLAASWVTSMAVQALLLRQFTLGIVGVHVWEIPIERFGEVYASIWIAAPLYVLAGSCTKVALLVFYLRVSPQQWLRYSVFATMFLITGYSTGIFFALIFACTPVRKSFDVTVPLSEGSCVSTAALYIATAVCNIVSDVILFILPMPMLYPLQMPLKQKLGLFFIFGIGSITVITSIIRATLLPQLLTTTDVTWDVATASLLIIIESNLIIICGMLPTLQKFFRHVAPKFIGETRTPGDGGSDAHPGSGFKSTSKLGPPKSPHLVTFGSLPVKARGYSRFGSRQSIYGYPLATIDGDDDNGDEEQVSQRERARDRTARVDTTVVAGHPSDEQRDWDAMGEEGLKPSSAGSQVPIVTTRIEVSYGRSDEVQTLPRKRVDTSFQ